MNLGKILNIPISAYIGETYSCHVNGNPLYLEYANDKKFDREGITCVYYTDLKNEEFIMTAFLTTKNKLGV